MSFVRSVPIETKANISQKKQLLDRHAKLFREHEYLLLQAYEHVQKVLTLKQIQKAAEIYERHKQILLDGLEHSLIKAVSPKLKISRKREKRKTK